MLKLIIHTNKYTGNFERELVAYSLGILQESQMDHSESFQKAFWTSVAGVGINSYDEYLSKIKNNDNFNDDNFFDVMDRASLVLGKLSEEDIKKRKEKRLQEKIDTDWSNFYENFLEKTYQWVDDIEEDTFYNIESYYKNNKYNCDSIYIQLKKEPTEYFEKTIINRIKDFFENNILDIITNYDWVCQFGHKSFQDNSDLKLLDLELIDENNNLIKKYC